MLADDDDRKFAFYTDSRKVEKSKDPTHQDFDAKWEEYRLVAEGKDPRGNKYERSYEVLQGNRQLRETFLLKVGRNNTEVSIRYVYDLDFASAKDVSCFLPLKKSRKFRDPRRFLHSRLALTESASDANLFVPSRQLKAHRALFWGVYGEAASQGPG